jgi:hypothetical protein
MEESVPAEGSCGAAVSATTRAVAEALSPPDNIAVPDAQSQDDIVTSLL